jgi:hypothetical protein
LTVRSLLLEPHHADAGDLLTDAVEQRGVGATVSGAVGGLTSAGRHAVCEEVAHVADSLLDLDVTDVLAMAWKKHADLTAAGRRTAEHPGSEELVPLATHTIRSTHRPCVDVFIDEVKVTDVEIELALTLVLTGVLAVVRDGLLVELHGGSCDATAALGCENVPIARRSAHVTFPASVPLRPPVDLRPNSPGPPRGHPESSGARGWRPAR